MDYYSRKMKDNATQIGSWCLAGFVAICFVWVLIEMAKFSLWVVVAVFTVPTSWLMLAGWLSSRSEEAQWNGGRCRLHALAWRPVSQESALAQHFIGDDEGEFYRCRQGCMIYMSYPREGLDDA